MEEICRICLRQQENVHELYSNALLVSKIETISSMELLNDPFYPSRICDECVEHINNYFKFRETVISNFKKLNEEFDLQQKQDNCELEECQDKCVVIETVKIKIESDGDTQDVKPDTGECETKQEKQIKRRLYDCPDCSRKFTSRFKFYNHRRSHTTKGVCNICGVSVRTDNLNKHIQLHTEGPATCEICDKVFKNSESLRGHRRSHMGFEFTCEVCGRLFKIKSEYTRHIKAHTDPEFGKQTCEICLKKVRHLRKHMLSHTGERPNKCTYCNKGFTSSYALKVHVRQHTNEKPFMCELCPVAFPQKVSLVTHLKSRHDIIV